MGHYTAIIKKGLEDIDIAQPPPPPPKESLKPLTGTQQPETAGKWSWGKYLGCGCLTLVGGIVIGISYISYSLLKEPVEPYRKVLTVNKYSITTHNDLNNKYMGNSIFMETSDYKNEKFNIIFKIYDSDECNIIRERLQDNVPDQIAIKKPLLNDKGVIKADNNGLDCWYVDSSYIDWLKKDCCPQ